MLDEGVERAEREVPYGEVDATDPKEGVRVKELIA